jgi:hypothetical protein
MRAVVISNTTLDALAAKMPLEELVTGGSSWYPVCNVICGKYPVDNWHRNCQKAMQITTPGRRVFPFEVTREGVSTCFLEIDIICGVGVSDERKSSLIEPVGRTTRCRSSEEVFKALGSCLLTTMDSSPHRWMLLAALFACVDKETGAASSSLREGTFDQFLKSYGDFVVSGRTLTTAQKAFNSLIEAALRRSR